MTIRVVLADDQSLLRKGFRMILEAEDDITVIGEAADGEAGVRLVELYQPDVVLMDVRMPTLDGIGATRAITASGSPSHVLILTTFDLDEYAFGALRAGASGFLLQDVPPHELGQAIRTVARGGAVVSPRSQHRRDAPKTAHAFVRAALVVDEDLAHGGLVRQENGIGLGRQHVHRTGMSETGEQWRGEHHVAEERSLDDE